MKRVRKGRRQLHVLTGANFQAPDFVDIDGTLITKPGNDIPLLSWPNGRWCHPANTFMRSLFEKRLSRHNRGGSLAVAASNLSHLLRFCWQRGKDPIELTDNLFREFVRLLTEEEHPKRIGQKKRDADTVIRIGRTCLQFLSDVGKHAGDSDLIGSQGRIRAVERVHDVRLPSRGNKPRIRRVVYWHHEALPAPSEKRTRPPISQKNIAALRAAASEISTSSHQRARRQVLITLLEVTGARRGELAELTVESVEKACLMEYPMLRVLTLKKKTRRYRLIPVPRADLVFIRQYLLYHRAPTMRLRRPGMPEHGILLVSEVDGEALRTNTLTQEISLLANAAGLAENACPHMFRHRFLTKIFVALIEQHKVENADEFRRLLLDTETLKRKVAEWTDHSDLATLDRYIDLAFEEIGNFRRIYNLTNAGIAVDSFVGLLHTQIEELKLGASALLVAERLVAIADALKVDLEAAKSVAPA